MTTPPRPWETDRRAGPRRDEPLKRQADKAHAFARASRAHDLDTGDHVVRIRVLVERIALRLGFTRDDAVALSYDAMLHDVGKMRVPAALLRKPSPLTSWERAVVGKHTLEGERMLGRQKGLERAARIARSHHECFDGSGLPDGLKGEAIPLEARITTVADVFDALTSARPYKEAWSPQRAIDELKRLAGRKLDPHAVSALVACFESGELNSITVG